MLQDESKFELNRQSLLDSDRNLALPERLSLSRLADIPFQNPTEKDAADGTVILEVKYGNNSIGTQAVKLRSYNGLLVGPTLRVKAGQTLRVSLKNSLPAEPVGGPHVTNGHHDWNTTNLHTHGLHVKPQANPDSPDPAPIESDNVLIELEPSTTPQEYAFEIPADHPAGTFWYHAHKHGSTSAQVSSGMAGALIVTRDDEQFNLDAIPEVAAASGDGREKIMIFQQIPYLVWNLGGGASEGRIELVGPTGTSAVNAMFGPNRWGPSQRYTTINGQQLPVIEFVPGEIQRWRMIDSGFREGLSLQIIKDPGDVGAGPDHIDFCEIAVDGLATNARTIMSHIEMSPGYRSDVLVQAPSVPGTYHLIDAKRETGTLLGESESLKFIAKVVIKDAPSVTMSLPTDAQIKAKRLPSLPDPLASTPIQHAYYGLSGGFVIGRTDPGVNGAVSGKQFEMNPTDLRVLDLGDVQKWKVGTRNDFNFVGEAPPPPPRGPAHPFHIHVNPFEIVSIKDPLGVEQLPVGERIWRDTISMPPGYTYEFLTRYDEFRGSFVQHCHILDHEDRGMMEKITIRDPYLPSPTPLTSADSRSPLSKLQPNSSDGKSTVTIFVKGSFCPHCMEQLTEMAKSLAAMKLDVTVVSASTEDDLKNFPDVPFRLVADPEYKLFIEAGAFDGEAKHATIVRDRSGKEVLRVVGEAPFMDSEAILTSLDGGKLTSTEVPQLLAQAARIEIEIWSTPTDADDYVTWAPTPARIRQVGDDTTDLLVVLTNDSEGFIPAGRDHPLDGNLRFAKAVNSGETPTASSLEVSLPAGGEWLDFVVAGEFPRSSSRDKDAVIEVHGGSVDGPLIHSHALMVRIRKDHRELTADERGRFLDALDYLHRRTIRPDGRSEYMYFVGLHEVSALGIFFGQPGFEHVDYFWPDMAHKGPAFIAWHRAFLLQFERELQKTHPDVALPYWVMPESSLLFAPDFMGSNVIEQLAAAVAPNFSPDNPLFGWTVDGAFIQRHAISRTPGTPGFPAFNTDTDLFNKKRYSNYPNVASAAEQQFTDLLERNPHNGGHNWTGPWLQNCRTSPRDPIFWVFHTGFDRQWARWQHLQGRFEPSGGNHSYHPLGAFHNVGGDPNPCDEPGRNGCTPIGHSIEDPMWPWNNKTGQASTKKGSQPQPNLATPFTAPFPASSVAGLWPASAASPTPGDMIDYMGLHAGREDMGFAYDDTPYGVAPAELALAETASENNLADFLDTAASMKNRIEAGRSATATSADGSQLKALREMLASKGASVEFRQQALRLLQESYDEQWIDVAIGLLDDPEDGGEELDIAAIDAIFVATMFGDLGDELDQKVMGALTNALSNPRLAVRQKALQKLAPMANPQAVQTLADALQPVNEARATAATPISTRDAIRGLTVAGKAVEKADLIRPFVLDDDPNVRASAILALGADAGSQQQISLVISDHSQPYNVRSAAVQSIFTGGSIYLDPILEVVKDPTDDVRIQAEAIAGLGVLLRTPTPSFSAEQASKIAGVLQAVDAERVDRLGPAFGRALHAALRQSME